MKALVLGFGVVTYAIFFGTFLAVIGFLCNFGLEKTIDSAGLMGLGKFLPSSSSAVWTNLFLLAVFGVQHSVMARPQFKAWWTKIVNPAIERSIYVLLTSIILIVWMNQWVAMPQVIWSVENSFLRTVMMGISGIGYAIVLLSTFNIDHFDLFGLRQVWLYYKGEGYSNKPFTEKGFYKVVRHPLMLGFMVAFWVWPDMTEGRMLFSVVTTLYVLVALQLEEKDLAAHLGQAYMDYQKRTPMLFPFGKKGKV